MSGEARGGLTRGAGHAGDRGRAGQRAPRTALADRSGRGRGHTAEDGTPRHLRRKLATALLAALALFAFQLAHAQTSSAATGIACAQTGFETLTTDRTNYTGGDTAHITGTGYASACDVTIAVTRPDGAVETATATTDPISGSLSYDYAVPGPPSIQGDFKVDALGLGDVVLASTTFTDALTVKGDIVPSYVTGAVPTTFRLLYRNTSTDTTTREVDVKLPAGYTAASVDGTAFSDGGAWVAVTPAIRLRLCIRPSERQPPVDQHRLGPHRHHRDPHLAKRSQLEHRGMRQRRL